MTVLSNLPYKPTIYNEVYDDELFSKFARANFANGQIDSVQAREFVKKLNERASRVISGISFNLEKLAKSKLARGACSAISFHVAKKALTLLKTLSDNIQLKQTSKERFFALQFARYLHTLQNVATNNRAPDKFIQRTIRTEQAALNTITVDREIICTGNALTEKVKAMAQLYSLNIIESSPQIRVRDNMRLEPQLLDQLITLTEGVYLLRMIHEKDNHKLEFKGHTVVYIKTQDAEYNFDPFLGSYTLFCESSKTNFIYNALLSANQQFGVDTLSFHKLALEMPIA